MISIKQNEIRCYIYDLVSNDKVCYAHLNEEEKSILTGLIIKNSKPNFAHEFVTESDKGDQLPYLLANYLISKGFGIEYNNEKANNLIEYMSQIATKHAEITIDDMLNDVKEQFEFDKKFYKDDSQ
ncbi:MAG TPA: hypothetical protein VNF93_02510 [Buchnera sp. (in: enterobacteria)]|nr:hypothetical protein [Buchnera sp. (in: enterobacteria)]